jgi:hypothetical protein
MGADPSGLDRIASLCEAYGQTCSKSNRLAERATLWVTPHPLLRWFGLSRIRKVEVPDLDNISRFESEDWRQAAQDYIEETGLVRAES